MSESVNWRRRIAHAAPVALLFAVGSALGTLFLPGVVTLVPGRGQWDRVATGLRLRPDGSAFAGGSSVRLQLDELTPDTEELVIKVSLRRQSNPTRLFIALDGKRVAELTLEPLPRTARIALSSRARSARVDLEAVSQSRAFWSRFLLHELQLRRSHGGPRLLLQLLPGVGAVVVARLLSVRIGSGLSLAWGFHSAILFATAVSALWDRTASLRFEAQLLPRLAWSLAGAAALLVLVQRLRAAPAPAPALGGSRLTAPAIIRWLTGTIAAGLAGLGFLIWLRAPQEWLFGTGVLAGPEAVARTERIVGVLLSGAAITAYLGLLLSTFRWVGRLSERILGTLVFCLVSAALVGGLEAVLALRYAPVYRPPDLNAEAIARRTTYLSDPYFGHLLNPESKEPYRINSAGYRGDDFPVNKVPGEVRIVALGDSITFGIDVTAPFPVRLQDLLASLATTSRSYRVINGGVPAYDSLQALRLLGRRVVTLDPDIVIVTVGWNDLSWSYDSAWHPERSIDYRGRPVRFRPAVFQALSEWTAVKRASLAAPHPDAVVAYRTNLEATVAFCRERGIIPILTNLPTILSVEGNTPEELKKARGKLGIDWNVAHLRLFQAQIDAVCRETGAACVQGLLPLSESAKGRYFRDHCHFSEEGHAKAARILLDFLLERRLLSSVPRGRVT